MLMAVAVFAIVMSVSSSIFINVNSLQQQTANMAGLQNEGRYVLEKISKEIRGRELDYSQTIISATGMAEILVFKKDEFGQAYKIYFDPAGQAVMIETDDGVNGASIAPLNSSGVAVTKLIFKISPSSDPYDVSVAAPPLEQPRVTILMQIMNRNVPDKYIKTLLLQTTISSKVYK